MSNEKISPAVYSELVDASGFVPAIGASGGITAITHVFANRGEDNVIKLKNGSKTGGDSLRAEYGSVVTEKYNDLGYAGATLWVAGGLNARVCRLTAPNAKKASILIGIKPKTLPVHTVGADATVFYEVGKSYSVDSVIYSAKKDTFYLVTEDIIEKEERYENHSRKLETIHPFIDTVVYENDEYARYEEESTGEILIKQYDAVGDTWVVTASAFRINDYFEALTYSESARADKESNGFVTLGKFHAIGSGADYNGMFIILNEATNKTAVENGVVVTSMSAYDYNKNNAIVAVKQNSGEFTFAEHRNVKNVVTTAEPKIRTFASTIVYKSELLTSTVVNPLLDIVKGKLISNEARSIADIMQLNVLKDVYGKRLFITGGSDGDLIKEDGTVDEVLKQNLIIDFYQGNTDPSILERNVNPARFCFNLIDNTLIAKVIDSFTKLLRDDVFVFHAGNDFANPAGFLNWRKREFTVSNHMSGVYGGYKDIIDIFTKSELRVPLLYLKIGSWSKQISDNGLGGAVLAGYDGLGLIAGASPKEPVFSKPKQDDCYLAKINPPVVSDNKLYYVATRTTQESNSKLSMAHVSYIQAQMMVDMEILGKPFIDKFITEGVLTDIKSTFSSYFLENWLPTPAIKSFYVNTESTETDEENNLARVDVEIEFANILEKLVITRTIK